MSPDKVPDDVGKPFFQCVWFYYDSETYAEEAEACSPEFAGTREGLVAAVNYMMKLLDPSLLDIERPELPYSPSSKQAVVESVGITMYRRGNTGKAIAVADVAQIKLQAIKNLLWKHSQKTTDAEPMIEKSLTLSTTHVPRNSPGSLKLFDFGNLTVGRHKYGWIVMVPISDVDELENLRASEYMDIPEWLMPILKLAARNGCTTINFDRDARKLDGLETYDWESDLS